MRIFVAALLLTASAFATALAQQGVTQEERDWMEQQLWHRIRACENGIAFCKERIAECEKGILRWQRSRSSDSASMVLHHQRSRAKAENDLREWERKKRQYEEELRNLPPARDEARERAEAEQKERVARQQEASRERETESARQNRAMQDFSDKRNEKIRSDHEKNLNLLNNFEKGFKDATAWIKDLERNKVEEIDTDYDSNFGETQVDQSFIPPQRERQRVVGRIDNGEFIPNTVVAPEPAKPLFDSLGAFLSEVAKQTTESLMSGLVNKTASGDLESFETDVLKAKGQDLQDSMASILSPEMQGALYLITGQSDKAYDAMMERLPPERQLDARAARLPLSIITGDYADRLDEIRDKHIDQSLGTQPSTSASPDYLSRATKLSMSFYEERQPPIELVTPKHQENGTFRVRRNMNEVTTPVLKFQTLDDARAHVAERRKYWEANRESVWQWYGQTQADADRVWRDTLKNWDRQLEIKAEQYREWEEAGVH